MPGTAAGPSPREPSRARGPHWHDWRPTLVAAIAFAVGALLLTTFPIASGVDVEPPSWQVDAVFFGLLALTALMVGAFAVVLTSLYATVADVLATLPQDWIAEILDNADDEDDEQQATDPSQRD